MDWSSYTLGGLPGSGPLFLAAGLPSLTIATVNDGRLGLEIRRISLKCHPVCCQRLIRPLLRRCRLRLWLWLRLHHL